MTLLEKQKLFSLLVRDLLSAIHAMGLTCTLGDAFRDERVHGKYGEKMSYSASKSLHKVCGIL